MVTRLMFLFLLLPLFLVSGEFTASVSKNEINLGESFTLYLTLKGGSSKSTPAIDSLKKMFIIHSQQQSSNTVIMNGQITVSKTWLFTLIPQKEGEAVIPSLTLDTSDGMLSTEPIKITILKGNAAAGSSDSSDIKGVTLTTSLTNAKPYKNEPFVYTLRLASKRELANIKMEKIDIEDAIVESNGEPKSYEEVIDGMRAGVVEFSYLITPLKAGPLKIPSAIVQGVIPIRRQNQMRSFFDDSFDPFSMMHGFGELKPFALMTEEAILEVQPPQAGLNPWLPARSLKIEEIWDESQPLQTGEPFTRGFKIVAEGIKSNQLPSLNELQTSHPHFKIYADKPELGDEVKDGIVKSYRKEHFTLIPQQSGDLLLPEISVAWWDVTKKEKVITRIPSRTVQVLPALQDGLKSQVALADEPATQVDTESQGAAIQRDPLLYVLIGGLTLLLAVAIIWGIILQKKIVRITEKKAVDVKNLDKLEKYPQHADSVPEGKQPTRNKKEKLPDLNPT